MSAPAEPGRTHALQYRFAAHLRDPQGNPAPEGIEDRRLQIYRELFFNNVEDLLSANFPVIRSLYVQAQWYELVRAFYREHRSHTPLFPEIGREFQRYLTTRAQRGEDDPPFLLELAHYEWSELALSLDENEISALAHDPDGDPLHGIPVVSPLAWRLAYRFPVHQIRTDFRPQIPPSDPTFLLMLRNRADEVSFLQINPLTSLLLERLQENSQSSGLDCLRRLLTDLGNTDADALVASGSTMLLELKQRDAILGTRR